MISLRSRRLLVAFVAPAMLWAAKGKMTSEILTPTMRQVPVDLAARLTRPPVADAPRADLKSPFNPPEFDRPTPEEAKLAAAKAAAAGAPAVATPAAGAATSGAGATPAGAAGAKPSPASDREILELVAARIPSSGIIIFSGKSLLVVGGKRYEVGNRFTVTHGGQDYELELVAIERTTFTLRYRGEQFARPITLR
jgi:hypothetical protein